MKKKTVQTGWLKWSTTPKARFVLFIVTLTESAFFPVPPDPLFIPLVLKNRSKTFWIATIAVLGSMTGAYIGYSIGWSFFEVVGAEIIQFYKLGSSLELVRTKFIENALLTIIMSAFTPIPYLVFTIAAGLFKVPLYIFLIGSLIGRSLRFYLEASLLYLYGKQIQKIIDKNILSLTLAFFALLLILFIVFNFWL